MPPTNIIPLDEADRTFGLAIYSSTSLVIRMKREKDKQSFFYHRVKDGEEHIPHDYLSGLNFLEYHLRG